MAKAKQVRRRLPAAFGVDAGHLCQALAGMSYPAQRWQVLSWAEYNEAGRYVITELNRLPAGLSDDLEQVANSLREVRQDGGLSSCTQHQR